jgi:type VI secretion system protein VasD
MKFLRVLLTLLVIAPLFGCSTLTDSIARRASEMVTQKAMNSMNEVDLDRQVHLTLVGGAHLNPGRNSAPRPAQICIYVVQTSDWRPAQQAEQSVCMSKEKDVNIVAATRLLLAPQQIQQTQLQVSGMRELWVVVDAEFAQRPVDYVPLRMKVEGRGWVHLSAWVEGTGIYDGKVQLPANASSSTVGQAPSPATVRTIEVVNPSRSSSSSRQNSVSPGLTIERTLRKWESQR